MDSNKEDDIAVVYADGNSMGKEIKKLTSIDEYKKFSKAIDPDLNGDFDIDESEEFLNKLNITLEMALVTEIRGLLSV
jgi:hypothetical protein